MMLYHACWDMMFLFGIWMDWYAGMPGRLWQQTICWVFILLSGFCAPFGRHMLRRGVTVFAAGALVTAVTLVFMPGDRVIFGVLTFLGSAMLLTGVLEPLLKKIPPAAGLAVSAVLFALTYHLDERWLGFGGLRLALPDAWYANYFTAFFGFLPFDFYSTDYFALLPWLFLFWAGYFLHGVVAVSYTHLVPNALVEITEKAMAKLPQNRYASAREMLDALDTYVHNPSVCLLYTSSNAHFVHGHAGYCRRVPQSTVCRQA